MEHHMLEDNFLNELQPLDHDEFEGHGFSSSYSHYVYPVLLIVVIAVNLLALILIIKSRFPQIHHAATYAAALLTSIVLSCLFQFFNFILTETTKSSNAAGVSALCRIFQFFWSASYRSYVPLLTFALIDRLIQTLANRSSSVRLGSAARTFCNGKASLICISTTAGLSAIISAYHFFIRYTVRDGACYHGENLLLDHLEQMIYLFLTILLIIACLAYSALCCVKDKKHSGSESEEKGTKAAEEDWKATKAFLILFGLFFLLHVSVIAVQVATTTTEPINPIVDVLYRVYHTVIPLIFLLYWPGGLKRQREGESAYLIK